MNYDESALELVIDDLSASEVIAGEYTIETTLSNSFNSVNFEIMVKISEI